MTMRRVSEDKVILLSLFSQGMNDSLTLKLSVFVDCIAYYLQGVVVFFFCFLKPKTF